MKNQFTVLTATLILVASSFLPAQAAKKQDFPEESLREFQQVFAIVRENYVDEIDDDVLIRNAIRGMVENLDPHSTYLGKEIYENFNRSLTGLYGGVGLYIDQDRGLIRVVSPIDDSPAKRAGMLTNDFIIKIDNESTEGMAVGDAANLMRGLAGTMVTLSVVRLSDDSRDDFEVELEREEINSPSVRSALADNGIGFIRISQFLRSSRTAAELANEVDKLYTENGGPLKGVILDLRNNPGGDLSASICVASMFLDRGVTVVSDRGRNKENKVHGSDLTSCQSPEFISQLRKVNIAVLVNKGSASASEIVAGAIQDNSRGIIVGTTTFGKASVQRIWNLEATDYKSGVKLTSGHYYTPSGKSIHKIGIQPDVEIEFERVEPEQASEGGEVKADELSNLATLEEKNTSILPIEDNQFDKAVELLLEKQVS